MNFDSDLNPFGTALTRAWLTDLEKTTDFWNLTPQLQQIAWEASLDAVSPWGVLAVAMEHQASHIDPTHVLPRANGSAPATLVGGTSLAGFVCLEGRSGGGKSTVMRIASELVPPAVRPIPDGTGQGIAKSIAETVRVALKDDGTKLDVPYIATRFHHPSHTAVIHSSEIGTINAEFAREGSKTADMLRQMWMGEATGTTTSDQTRNISLPANLYRVHGIWGAQPTKVREIMLQADAGTPQRFVWAPAVENRVLADTPQRIQPATTATFNRPQWNVGANPYGALGGALTDIYKEGDPLPPPVIAGRGSSPMLQQWLIDHDALIDAAKNRDPYAPPSESEAQMEASAQMAAHMRLTVLKQAVKVAWLHARCEPTDLDTSIALIQMQVSTAVAAGVWDVLARAEADAAKRVGKERGAQMHAAAQTRDELEADDIRVIAEELWRHLAANGPATTREMRKPMSNSKRALIPKARDLLEEEGRLAYRGRQYWALFNDAPLPACFAAQFHATAAG